MTEWKVSLCNELIFKLIYNNITILYSVNLIQSTKVEQVNEKLKQTEKIFYRSCSL